MNFILFVAWMSTGFTAFAEDKDCRIQIGATFRENGYPVDSKVPDNLVPGFFREGVNYRAENWSECYQLAIRETKKAPPEGAFHVSHCLRLCMQQYVDGAKDTPGSYYMNWFYSDGSRGSVSFYTDTVISQPAVGDQRFHADQTLFH